MTMNNDNVKTKIMEAVARGGDFVNTDGEWCGTRTPEQFKAFLEAGRSGGA